MLPYVLFIQQRQGPDYHIIKVSLSTFIYCLLLNMHPILPIYLVLSCTSLPSGHGAVGTLLGYAAILNRHSKQCHLHMFAMISFYPPSFALFHPLSRLWQQFYFSVEQPSD